MSKGLRTFFRRYKRSEGHTALASTIPEREDYCRFKRSAIVARATLPLPGIRQINEFSVYEKVENFVHIRVYIQSHGNV